MSIHLNETSLKGQPLTKTLALLLFAEFFFLPAKLFLISKVTLFQVRDLLLISAACILLHCCATGSIFCTLATVSISGGGELPEPLL